MGVDHLFPSLPQMVDQRTSFVAKQYLMKLLRNVLKQKQSAIVRLKDPHLLLFLKLMSDDATFIRLCEFLHTVPTTATIVEEGTVSTNPPSPPRIPAELLITIEMIESSLRLSLEDPDFSDD